MSRRGRSCKPSAETLIATTMPDENLVATLEQGLRQTRATRSRLAARLADLEAEAERVRTELNEMDAIISQTEAAMFRILSSSFSAQAGPASDAEIEYALRRDSAMGAPRPAQPQPALPQSRPRHLRPRHTRRGAGLLNAAGPKAGGTRQKADG